MLWLLLAPHHRRRTFSQRDVSLGEETSGNRWARGPDCTADGLIYGLSHLRWEIIWRSARRLWRDFGSALPFKKCLTQTKPVLPLSNEYGSQVKDEGRRHCCHNKHKKFPIGLHVMYLYFSDTPHKLYNIFVFFKIGVTLRRACAIFFPLYKPDMGCGRYKYKPCTDKGKRISRFIHRICYPLRDRIVSLKRSWFAC